MQATDPPMPPPIPPQKESAGPNRALVALAAGAAVVTIALTATAFWLSYEHLHDIAGGHGLSGSRAWAWPATVDLFIVAGELLTLRASLQNRVDGWAIALAAFGSSGSIALNIFGVGHGASPLDYTVAAVPPTAALIAFGALMRQVHSMLARSPAAAAGTPTDALDRAASKATALASPPQSTAAPAAAAAVGLPASAQLTPDAHPAAPAADADAAARSVPASTASDDDLIDAARALRAFGPLSLRRLQSELAVGQRRAQRIRDALDEEAS